MDSDTDDDQIFTVAGDTLSMDDLTSLLSILKRKHEDANDEGKYVPVVSPCIGLSILLAFRKAGEQNREASIPAKVSRPNRVQAANPKRPRIGNSQIMGLDYLTRSYPRPFRATLLSRAHEDPAMLAAWFRGPFKDFIISLAGKILDHDCPWRAKICLEVRKNADVFHRLRAAIVNKACASIRSILNDWCPIEALGINPTKLTFEIPKRNFLPGLWNGNSWAVSIPFDPPALSVLEPDDVIEDPRHLWAVMFVLCLELRSALCLQDLTDVENLIAEQPLFKQFVMPTSIPDMDNKWMLQSRSAEVLQMAANGEATPKLLISAWGQNPAGMAMLWSWIIKARYQQHRVGPDADTKNAFTWSSVYSALCPVLSQQFERAETDTESLPPIRIYRIASGRGETTPVDEVPYDNTAKMFRE